jgi:hypothetical protein
MLYVVCLCCVLVLVTNQLSVFIPDMQYQEDC